MRLASLLLLLPCAHVGLGIPVTGRRQQTRLGGPTVVKSIFDPPPFTPGHRDPFDRKHDSVGQGTDPLPFRNGDGASVLGPQNPERQRQNPDLMRPPSTDHGSMANMRWSFADSHVRIEASGTCSEHVSTLTDHRTGRRMDATDHHP
jgi:hypothetical protein